LAEAFESYPEYKLVVTGNFIDLIYFLEQIKIVCLQGIVWVPELPFS